MPRVSLFVYDDRTKALTKKFPKAIFYDDKCTKPFTDENGFKVKPASEFNAKYSDLEIPSPKISSQNQLIKKAKNLQSEYDIFAYTTPLKIWIDATDKKHNVTKTMQHLLESYGSQACGNELTSVAKLDVDANIWIIETCSFTTKYTNIMTPNIYVLPPIKSEDMENKLKHIKSMKEGEVVIIPEIYQDIKTDALLITYKSAEDLASRFSIDTKKINAKATFLIDALLAMAVEKILFDNIDYKKINNV